MRYESVGTKWCHVRWLTYRRREHFKIAATARFCERALQDACAGLGWSVDAIAVLPDGVQLLAIVPAALTREQILEQIRTAATRVAKRAGVGSTGPKQVWEDNWWCAVLTNAAAVAAVRRHIAARSQSVWAGSNTPVEPVERVAAADAEPG